MSTEEFSEKLIRFLQVLCEKHSPGVLVKDDTKLFDDRLINSIRIIDIMSFVERELCINIPDDKLTMKYFRTPGIIVQTFCEV